MQGYRNVLLPTLRVRQDLVCLPQSLELACSVLVVGVLVRVDLSKAAKCGSRGQNSEPKSACRLLSVSFYLDVRDLKTLVLRERSDAATFRAFL